MTGSSKSSSAGKKKQEKNVYPHSPLIEVVFEIRFNGEPAVECRRDEYFSQIRESFPAVFVPGVEPGLPPALQPYHFRSPNESETIMVALNRFAYATKSYGSFKRFESRAIQLTKTFCNLYRITRLNRTGLRYINAIPFVRENGIIPFKRYFNLDLVLSETKSADFLNFSLAFETRCEAGVITTRLACASSPLKDQEVFILDFDFAKTERLVSSALISYIEESHEHTKLLFEGLIADDYKAVMRGEAIE